MIIVTLPLKTISEANSHQHWRVRHRRAKGQRTIAALTLRAKALAFVRTYGASCIVTLTRLAPSKGLDSDNLAGSQKHIRDGIADALGIDDGDGRVVWRYRQERANHYAVRVEITRWEEGALPPDGT